MSSEEDRWVAAMTAGMADPQRMKLGYGGTVVDVNFAASPKLVSVVLDFGSGTVPVWMPYRQSYANPQVGDVIDVEVQNYRHVALGTVAT